MRYRAFLSYSHKDRTWARWLHRKLEAYRVPEKLVDQPGATSRRLSPIFRDRDELPSVASLSGAVDDALRESEWLIVLCSPDAAASRWVNEEIRAFRRFGRSHRILCFIVRGEPASGGATECLPAALTEPAPDGARVEPLAADARPEGDGKVDALLKVIAGMLGVGLDALKQREHRRRNRRLVATTAASLAIAAVTATLAVAALIARNEADVRRAQAEDLIDFMLGDLREQLREISRLDLYQSVGDQALRYFASLSEEDVSDRTLAQRAKNLRQIGEVRLDQGQLSAALIAFEESLSIMTRLAERDPSNADNQIALANSYFFVGYAHWQAGDLEAARQRFEQVVPIVDAVSAREPDNPTWLRERGYGYTNLGRVLELEGKLDEALDAYRIVLSNNERLVDLEPDNTEWMLELGFAHNNIGKLVTALGRLDEAEQSYRYDLDIKTRVLATNPQHNTWRSYLAVGRYYLGQLLGMKGRYDDAESMLSLALTDFEDLARFDPAFVEWQSRLANTQRELGEVLVASGRADTGLILIKTSVESLARLSDASEADAAIRRDLTRGLLALASIEVTRGDLAAASRHSQTASTQVEALLISEPMSRETRQLAVHADVCAARIAEQREPRSGAEPYLRALASIERDFGDTSDPNVLWLAAAALSGLGRHAEAAAIEGQLRQMGFAHGSTE